MYSRLFPGVLGFLLCSVVFSDLVMSLLQCYHRFFGQLPALSLTVFLFCSSERVFVFSIKRGRIILQINQTAGTRYIQIVWC